MGKTLIIAEKPSVAKDIALSLGGFAKGQGNWLERNDMIVAAAAGHLAESYMPAMDTTGKTLDTLPVIDSFSVRVIEGDRNQAQAYANLKNLMDRNDVDRVVNACDAGREGELIFRLIYKLADCTKPMFRLWCQSMTPEGIRDSYRDIKPSSHFDALAAAAFARTEGDYTVGINGSRAVTRLYERQTAKAEIHSVGRVQTPTGAIVYDREMAIRNFVRKDFWEIHGHFGVAAGTYVGKWFDPNAKQAAKEGASTEKSDSGQENKPEDTSNRFYEKSRADAIVAKCSGVNPSDVREESKPSEKRAPKLYDLTQLQREANRKLGFSAKQTLDIAQALYEKHKVTTYPRTDSTALPEDYVPKAKSTAESLLDTEWGAHAKRVLDNGWIRPTKQIFDNSKISDHFAIVPTGKKPEGLSPDEAKIYDMVARRFLAAFHPSAEYQVTTRITIVSGEHFKSTGRVLTSDGWLAVYGTSVDDDDKKTPALAKYTKGESVSTQKIELKTLKTSPPDRFTEDTLLAAMETAGKLVDDEQLAEAMKERGLGTPATRAAIIEGLLSTIDGRGQKKEPFLKRDGKSLMPTPKLMGLIKFLRENDLDILASPAMTGDWEYKLHRMERNDYERETFSNEIIALTKHIIDVVRAKAASVVVKKLQARCPKCGGEVSVGARAFACESNCGFQLWKEIAGRDLRSSEAETLLANGKAMNLTGFLSKDKKKFVACLRLTEEFKVEFFFDETRDTTDRAGNPVHCPKCEKLMRRIKGSKGYFWSCNDRENCKTTLDDEDGNPVQKVPPQECPKCRKDMNRIKGSKGYFWACSDRDECKHTMNDKDGAPAEKPQGHPCPDCGKPMYRRERTARKGTYFWGCSGYKREGDGCSRILDDHDGVPVLKPAGEAASDAATPAQSPQPATTVVPDTGEIDSAAEFFR
ncbi:TPA: DNA topoisomerase [Burkholderia lata]